MFWTAATLLLGILGYLCVDGRQWRRLFPLALAGLLMAGAHAVVPTPKVGIRLSDSGPLGDHVLITLLLQTVGGPVLAVWFAQGADPEGSAPVGRMVAFAGISICLEIMAHAAGRIHYVGGWQPAYSLGFYVGWYAILWQVHRAFTRWRVVPSPPASGEATRR